MPHVSILNENWILDCKLGKDHQRRDPIYQRRAWKAGAMRTFEFCHHCQHWVEREFSWRDLLGEKGLRPLDDEE